MKRIILLALMLTFAVSSSFAADSIKIADTDLFVINWVKSKTTKVAPFTYSAFYDIQFKPNTMFSPYVLHLDKVDYVNANAKEFCFGSEFYYKPDGTTHLNYDTPYAPTCLKAPIDEFSGDWNIAVVPFLKNVPDGDVNGDGYTNIMDAMHILKMTVGSEPITIDAWIHGDVGPIDANKVSHPDSNIDITDALLVLKKCVGLESWTIVP